MLVDLAVEGRCGHRSPVSKKTKRLVHGGVEGARARDLTPDLGGPHVCPALDQNGLPGLREPTRIDISVIGNQSSRGRNAVTHSACVFWECSTIREVSLRLKIPAKSRLQGKMAILKTPEVGACAPGAQTRVLKCGDA
jgi:hypothetical protein